MTEVELAQPEHLIDEDSEDTQKDKYLSFSIGAEEYAIHIKFVTEIVVMQHVTAVPDMPDYIRGVINLRGKVISVMDVRTRFHLKAADYDERTCIIVIDVDEFTIGLIVDTVKEVVDIPPNLIDPPPRTHGGLGNDYVQGLGKIGNKVKILLDVEKIVLANDLEC